MTAELALVKPLGQVEPEHQADVATAMLVAAQQRLVAAGRDLSALCELKSYSHTLVEAVKQLHLSEELQLHATEVVRRTERALGVAIREGQERGEIETLLEARSRAGSKCRVHADSKPRPLDFASHPELSGSGVRPGIYAMTDGVSDEAFEEALAEARRASNLSRASVARLCRASVAAPPAPVPEPTPTKPVRKTAGGRRSMEHFTITLHAIANLIVNEHIDPAEIDFELHRGDIDSMIKDMNTIRGFLKKVGENHG